MRRGMRDLRTIYVCTYISIYVQAHTENTHMYTERHKHRHMRQTEAYIYCD